MSATSFRRRLEVPRQDSARARGCARQLVVATTGEWPASGLAARQPGGDPGRRCIQEGHGFLRVPWSRPRDRRRTPPSDMLRRGSPDQGIHDLTSEGPAPNCRATPAIQSSRTALSHDVGEDVPQLVDEPVFGLGRADVGPLEATLHPEAGESPGDGYAVTRWGAFALQQVGRVRVGRKRRDKHFEPERPGERPRAQNPQRHRHRRRRASSPRSARTA